MSEKSHEKSHNTVTLDEYEQGKPWCATAEDLVDAFRGSREEPIEERKPCRFTLRLLEQDGLTARDSFVELVAVNDSGLPLAVAVRQVMQYEQTGKREPYTVPEEGVIQEGSTEKGYFVAGVGTGGDELQNLAGVLREPKETQSVNFVAATLE